MNSGSDSNSNQHHERLHKQALGVWIVAAALVLVWPASIVTAPILSALDHTGISNPIYAFFSFLCHQQSDRSFYLLGAPFAVCARCFGVYLGLFLGFLLYPIFRRIDDLEPPSKIWLLLSTFPIGIDWTLGVLGIWENTPLSRAITGAILGATCAIYLVPAFIEIARSRR